VNLVGDGCATCAAARKINQVICLVVDFPASPTMFDSVFHAVRKMKPAIKQLQIIWLLTFRSD